MLPNRGYLNTIIEALNPDRSQTLRFLLAFIVLGALFGCGHTSDPSQRQTALVLASYSDKAEEAISQSILVWDAMPEDSYKSTLSGARADLDENELQKLQYAFATTLPIYQYVKQSTAHSYDPKLFSSSEIDERGSLRSLRGIGRIMVGGAKFAARSGHEKDAAILVLANLTMCHHNSSLTRPINLLSYAAIWVETLSVLEEHPGIVVSDSEVEVALLELCMRQRFVDDLNEIIKSRSAHLQETDSRFAALSDIDRDTQKTQQAALAIQNLGELHEFLSISKVQRDLSKTLALGVDAEVIWFYNAVDTYSQLAVFANQIEKSKRYIGSYPSDLFSLFRGTLDGLGIDYLRTPKGYRLVSRNGSWDLLSASNPVCWEVNELGQEQ